MTLREAAAYLRVGKSTIQRYLAGGKLTRHYVADSVKNVRVRKSEVLALMGDKGVIGGYRQV